MTWGDITTWPLPLHSLPGLLFPYSNSKLTFFKVFLTFCGHCYLPISLTTYSYTSLHVLGPSCGHSSTKGPNSMLCCHLSKSGVGPCLLVCQEPENPITPAHKLWFEFPFIKMNVCFKMQSITKLPVTSMRQYQPLSFSSNMVFSIKNTAFKSSHVNLWDSFICGCLCI